MCYCSHMFIRNSLLNIAKISKVSEAVLRRFVCLLRGGGEPSKCPAKEKTKCVE